MTPDTPPPNGDCSGDAIVALTLLELHSANNSNADCAGDDPAPIDLLSGPFVMTQAAWDDVMAGLYTVVARTSLMSGVSAEGEAEVIKTQGAVPTVSAWGAMVMIGLLLVAGTVTIRRVRPGST